MSARHLCRVEKYKTSRGIVYRGQPLPNLSSHSAVEYMLKCIPVLKDFHTTQDGETRELIVTTAVILRHFEELDDEDEDPALDTRPDEESPLLSQAEDVRAAYRKAEGEVRSLVLQVCGTAVQHPDTQPGLVNAILAIQMYGSYFTDPWEQEALKKTVQMFKDCQAWPLPKALRERYYKS
uniref:Uncharacterized protein n=1 Tax=Fusarium oxysporum (strain Fo5176) TaxID=660025 RepID=A0A0D2XFU3_FUSOF